MYKCPSLHTGVCVCAHKHTRLGSGLEIRLTGGNCGLYYSKRCSPCVNHSKLHPDERLKLPEQTAASSRAAPPLPQEEGEIHISWLWSPFPWAGALQLERNHHNSTNESSTSQQFTTAAWASLWEGERDTFMSNCGSVRARDSHCWCFRFSLYQESCCDVGPSTVTRVWYRWLGWGVVLRLVLMWRKHLRPLGPSQLLHQSWCLEL